MKNKLEQYEILRRIASENYNRKRSEIKTTLDRYEEHVCLSDEVKLKIKQRSEDLCTKINSLIASNTFELHNKHLMALIDDDKNVEKKLDIMLDKLNNMENECAKLNIEVKKYDYLIDGLTTTIESQLEKKQSSDLDELWLLRWNRS